MHLVLCTCLYIASRFKAKSILNVQQLPWKRCNPLRRPADRRLMCCGRSIRWREWAKSRGEQRLSWEERLEHVHFLAETLDIQIDHKLAWNILDIRRSWLFVPNQVFQSCWQWATLFIYFAQRVSEHLKTNSDAVWWQDGQGDFPHLYPEVLGTQHWSPRPLGTAIHRWPGTAFSADHTNVWALSESELWLVGSNFSGYSGYGIVMNCY